MKIYRRPVHADGCDCVVLACVML